MSRALFAILFVMVPGLVAGVPVVSAGDPPGDSPELVLDELGMVARPTLQCGSKDAIRQWETERLLRRTERARDHLSEFVHMVGFRLSSVLVETTDAMYLRRVAAFEDCIQEEPLLDLVCVAVAWQRPDICTNKEIPDGDERFCRLAVATVASVLEGNSLRCADLSEPYLRRLCERAVLGRPERSILCPVDDSGCQALTFLNLNVCRIWWHLISLTPFPFADACLWTFFIEALRLDPKLKCEGMPGMLQDLCRPVVANDPSTCPSPKYRGGFDAVALARRCRNAQVPAPEISTGQVAYVNGVILSIPLVNIFSAAATCRITVRLSADGRVQAEATSEPFTLQPAAGQNFSYLTVKRFRMAPAPAGLEVDVTSDCVWAAGENPTWRRDGNPAVD